MPAELCGFPDKTWLRCLQSCVGSRTRLGYAACRAVWVPGQDLATLSAELSVPGKDLAMLHLMHNCRSVFCHYTARYTYVCACVSMHMVYRGSSRLVLVIGVCIVQITRAKPSWACRRLWHIVGIYCGVWYEGVVVIM